METGDQQHHLSQILAAIQEAEDGTTGEIRVHLSRRHFDKNPLARATHLFQRFGMTETTRRNGVLLYVNLRRRKFAIVGDEGIHKVVGQKYWDAVSRDLSRHFRETHPDHAIALAVLAIGRTLRKFFPLEPGTHHSNELPNEVTRD